VVAIDASESMLAAATETPSSPGLRFVAGDIREVAALADGRFGGAICLGNTLPHLHGEKDLLRLFGGLRSRLTDGAPLLLQLLNYQKIFHSRQRHLPLNFRPEGDEEIIFLRLMRLGENGEVLFFPSTLRLVPGADPPLEVKTSKQVPLRGWLPAQLEAALEQGGFRSRTLYGAFDQTDFEPLQSPDLIVVAR
jgi:hypothetical protein